MGIPEQAILAPSLEAAEQRAKIGRRASVAAGAGTAVELFDFTIYGLLATTLAPLFFPTADHVAGLLSTLAVYASGFLARPVGAVVFGRIGDRYGRRRALLITIVIMGVATALTGLLPTYASIGVAAPVLLTALRIVQGL